MRTVGAYTKEVRVVTPNFKEHMRRIIAGCLVPKIAQYIRTTTVKEGSLPTHQRVDVPDQNSHESLRERLMPSHQAESTNYRVNNTGHSVRRAMVVFAAIPLW